MRTHQSIRLFENPWLERLSHVHPITPLVVWAPVVAYFLYRSIAVHELGWGPILAVGAAAVFVWTLTEYVLHRYFFHYDAKSEWGKRFFFIIHGNHHEDPQDPTRLVMPPVAGIAIGLVFYGLFLLVLGPVWCQPFFAFFIVGYLIYDYTHYAIHHFTPRTALGRAVKQSHMLHHFAMHDARWGVSSPLWDHIFDSLAPASKKDRQA